MDRTVQSILETTPLRSPRHGTLPTPSTVMPSESTSPTTAATLVVPMSRPTTISEVSNRPFMNSPSVPFFLCVPKASGLSPVSPTLPCAFETGQISAAVHRGSSHGRSSHPHHHPL